MPTVSYLRRRGQLEAYFDRTAAAAWSRLTSDQPVGRIRTTVRAGRDAMRRTLLDWLPADLRGMRVLDAGCGTGALAVEAARRGAHVVAVDLSPTLLDLARQRTPRNIGAGELTFQAGDMLDPDLGRFDYVVAMDSLIHYRSDDMVKMLSGLAARTQRGLLFTFAPSTPLLAVMHAVGRLFPRGNRAPSIQPVAESTLRSLLETAPTLGRWRLGRTQRIATGFYTSQALELSSR